MVGIVVWRVHRSIYGFYQCTLSEEEIKASDMAFVVCQKLLYSHECKQILQQVFVSQLIPLCCETVRRDCPSCDAE